MEQLLNDIRRHARETAGWTGKDHIDDAVLRAIGKVPRQHFVPHQSQPYAWENRPLPIGRGQTISQPFIVALMTDLIEPTPDQRVLDIGTGSGYQAAVLATLVKHVYTIEIVPELADSAARRLARLGYDNVSVRTGDGWHGWPEAAPFDAIIVAAVAEQIPPKLIEQLVDTGRLVMPLGPRDGAQQLVVIEKNGMHLQRREVLPVQFVPFTRAEDG